MNGAIAVAAIGIRSCKPNTVGDREAGGDEGDGGEKIPPIVGARHCRALQVAPMPLSPAIAYCLLPIPFLHYREFHISSENAIDRTMMSHIQC
ncbi:MAG: hypothetical protein RIE73_19315 [Coleofasciculus sp. C1-SOL-03]